MDPNKHPNSGHRPRSIDGFVTPGHRPVPKTTPSETVVQYPEAPAAAVESEPQKPLPARADPLDLSLPESPKPSRRFRLFGKRRRPGRDKLQRHSIRKRIIVAVVIVLLVALLGAGGYFGWKILSNASKVFRGNVLGAITSAVTPDKPLQIDQYGNTNILVLGTSESDPAHPAAQLTDSMMIVSFNQTNHNAFLLSVPRDLWVQYAAPCSVGYQGKINAAYECALNNADGSNNGDETKAENTVAQTVGNAFGINIAYVAHLNLAVVQKAVDAVGGVDIVINSPDPRGILDRNFDWRCQYKCYLVKYPNGPAHLDGTHAMWLAQARNDSGGYGLPRSNFDREDNQRKIAIAAEQKALSVGFLTNPVKISNLLDALGDNVHTTIDASYIKSFVDAAKNVPTSNITSIDILDSAPGVLTTGMVGGQSIVQPSAGLLSYSALQAFVQRLLAGHAGLIQEAAKVDVLNGSGVSGAAGQEATTLQQAGFTIGNIASAPDTYSSTDKYTLYDLSKGSKPNTLAALQKQLNVIASKAALPAGISSSAQFVVILGKPAATATSSTSN
ncbi:MAG TPA: LCP family protein [Candidatus Acidoferrum sp.]|nr:LCP family protein [Candidatus Acidoferrum sp.]